MAKRGRPRNNPVPMKESPIQPQAETVTQEPEVKAEAPAPLEQEKAAPSNIDLEPVVKKDISLPDQVSISQVSKSDWRGPGEEGHDRYTGTAEYLTVQNRRGSKELITGLTPELEARLEALLNLPGKSAVMPQGTLSKYNIDYWSTFRIEIPKGGKTLYLSDPRQELEYHVLKAHQQVANSQEELLTNAFARYVMSSEEEKAESVNKVLNLKSKAFNKFRNMNTSTMRGFIRVYNRVHNIPTTVNEDSSANFIEATVGTIVDEQPEKFLKVIDNDDYKMLLFVDQCIEVNVIRQERTKYFLNNGDMLGTTLETTIDYLKDDNNQDLYFTLKSQVDASK